MNVWVGACARAWRLVSRCVDDESVPERRMSREDAYPRQLTYLGMLCKPTDVY